MYYIYAFANIRSHHLGKKGEFSTPGAALKIGKMHAQMHFTELKMKYEYLSENRPYPVTVLRITEQEVPLDEIDESIVSSKQIIDFRSNE